MKVFHVFTNGEQIVLGEGEGKVIPCMLFVTAEKVWFTEESSGKLQHGVKISISGKRNPFPFKEIILTKGAIDWMRWLRNQGWEEIAREYID